MGSALAGAKAGAIGSLYFAGSISLFNLLLLFAFQSQALTYLQQNFSECSTPSLAQSCFASWIFLGIPLDDFIRTAILGFLFAMGIGIYFDFIPGRTYTTKALLGALVMLVGMLLLNLFGIVTSEIQLVLMVSFEIVAAVLYSVIIGRFYRRFTREVEFQSSSPSGKIVVDHRDLTGKKRTFATGSKHNVQAEGELKAFKGWLVSGGVTVNKPKEEKTSIKVDGDGLLKLGVIP